MDLFEAHAMRCLWVMVVSIRKFDVTIPDGWF